MLNVQISEYYMLKKCVITLCVCLKIKQLNFLPFYYLLHHKQNNLKYEYPTAKYLLNPEKLFHMFNPHWVLMSVKQNQAV